MLSPKDQDCDRSCITYIVRAGAAKVNSIRNRDFLDLQSKVNAHGEVEGEEGE
jgi:hypothetical protein